MWRERGACFRNLRAHQFDLENAFCKAHLDRIFWSVAFDGERTTGRQNEPARQGARGRPLYKKLSGWESRVSLALTRDGRGVEAEVELAEDLCKISRVL
ncbi:hypothetical protein CDD80_630 [Ophiocordyceps camponoti-rufipedis]|uniref:Uncharacterized protein n=1 Tax=Ophiocordyceps camponoti-rufipedis TaxID=2004952 RepID=A0A2C5ZHX2_9HYPO|nr:hypothetical protein CDD80_630 [Ophiocordyceps camponoti-rufipedis]